MKTIILIGEHHDFPVAKQFIAKNSQQFADSSFRQIFLEAVDPASIPKQVRSPLDVNNLLESYQDLYNACHLSNIKMNCADDVASRRIIESARVHPAFFNSIREDAFLKYLMSAGDSIFLTGAAHVAPIAKRLAAQGVNVLVLQTCPGSQGCLDEFTKGIDNTHLIYKTTQFSINQSIESLLVVKLKEMYVSVQKKMQQNSDQSFPHERKEIEQFYRAIQCFFSLKDIELQQVLSKYEYLIGSLFSRENDLDQAIFYTQASLTRKIDHQLGSDTIAVSEKKLAALREALAQAAHSAPGM